MGSFNQTCAVSRTPIRAGEAAVLVLLAHEPRFSSARFDIAGHTGSANAWRPVSLPIRGILGGYGRLESWDDGLAAAIAEQSVGIPLRRLMRTDRNAEFRMGDKEGGAPLSAVHFNAELFDRLTASTDDNVGNAVEGAAERFKHARFLDVALDASTKSPLAQALGDAVAEHPLNALRDVREAWTRLTGEHWSEAPYVSRFFGTDWHRQHPTLTQAVVAELERRHLAGLEGKEVLAAVLEYQILDANLDRLSREWLPSLTTGIDVDVRLHRELAEWTAARCDELDRSPDDDWEDDGAPTP